MTDPSAKIEQMCEFALTGLKLTAFIREEAACLMRAFSPSNPAYTFPERSIALAERRSEDGWSKPSGQ
jgi:hypothetical protein